MKKAILYLGILAGLAACDSEEYGVMPAGGPEEVSFSGSVIRAAGKEDFLPKYDMMTDKPDYGIVHVRHTRNGSFTSEDPQYRDADADLDFKANAGGLEAVKKEGTSEEDRWYWDGQQSHVFHAWTIPTDGDKQGEGTALATLEEGERYGTVNLKMDKKYEEGKRLSNLEYFIGAVKGPVTMTQNGSTRVTLDFKHLVAKIIVENIRVVSADGSNKELGENDTVRFSMPNMPNTARWTTGVPVKTGDTYDLDSAGRQEPRLLPLDSNEPDLDGHEMKDSDYGVEGTLKKGWSFYIYPCTFADLNTKGYELGEIEFFYNGRWFYGTLASLVALEKLDAGDCVALELILEEGEIGGLYPHIVDWSTSTGNVGLHDHPGIYDEADWEKYVDWLEEYKKDSTVEPPAGLFDADGNLNLYCDLDISDGGSKTPDDIIPEGKGKLKGNGHRVKTNSDDDWKKFESEMEDVWIQKKGGEYTHYE